MTTVRPSSGAGQNWDRGFVPPPQFQQLKQTRSLERDDPSNGLQPARPQAQQTTTFQQQKNQSREDVQATGSGGTTSVASGSALQTADSRRPPLAVRQSSQQRSSFFGFRRNSLTEEKEKSQSTARPTSMSQVDLTDSRPQHSRNVSTQSVANGVPNQQQPRRASLQVGPADIPLHPEIRSVVQLTIAHAHKIYFSGQLVRHVERQPDGHPPTKDEGWTEVWAQLGGTTLSIWDMKQIEEANKKGTEVPPTYVNITDAFVQVLGGVTARAVDGAPPKRYTNVLTVNTAGSNLLLFACSSTAVLMSWAAALRLAAWEKSRLEEIYTAHLLRITTPDSVREAKTSLHRGRMEGWVRIRVSGQTDWKRLWMVITAGTHVPDTPSTTDEKRSPSPTTHRKNRMSNLFSRDHSPPRSAVPVKPFLSLYASPKPKDRRKAFLSMSGVTQAFAVYPERPELISRSTLIKLEGCMGEEEGAGGMRNREGWLLVMPEMDSGNSQTTEMLKWIVAFHDAFELYGRPKSYTWDPRDPVSMMFAYPVGPHKNLLFLDREQVEMMDPRDDRTSAIRSRLLNIVLDRMQRPPDDPLAPQPGNAPRIGSPGSASLQLQRPPPQQTQQQQYSMPSGAMPQLPPLNFDSSTPQEKRALTPITEKSVGLHGAMSQSGEHSGEQSGGTIAKPPFNTVDTSAERHDSMLGGSVTLSPTDDEATHAANGSDNLRIIQEDGEDAGEANISNHSKSKTMTDDSQYSQPSAPTTPELRPISVSGKPDYQEHSPSKLSDGPSARDAMSSSTAAPPHYPAPPSSPVSVLTSPYSLASNPYTTYRPGSPQHRSFAESFPQSLEQQPSLVGSETPATSKASSLPLTPQQPHPPQTQISTVPPSTEDHNSLFDEAAALYYIQHADRDLDDAPPVPRKKPYIVNATPDDDLFSSSPRARHNILANLSRSSSPNTPIEQMRRGSGQTRTFEKVPGGVETKDGVPPPSDRGDGASAEFPGRKPGGARGLAENRRSIIGPRSGSPRSQNNHTAEGADDRAAAPEPVSIPTTLQPHQTTMRSSNSMDDTNADALAALSFLENEGSPKISQSPQPLVAPLTPTVESANKDVSPQASTEDVAQYRSSFAPSKQAAERKARTAAQQAATEAAKHKPGRSKSKRKTAMNNRGWQESSEEEEEEEEEEDDDEEEEEDVDSQEQPPSSSRGGSRTRQQAGGQLPLIRPLHVQARGPSPGESIEINAPQPRVPRNLPQIPRGRSPGDADDYAQGPQRRVISDQYSEGGRRTLYDEGSPANRSRSRPPPEQSHHGAPRQNMWIQALDPSNRRDGPPEPGLNRDTFVQMEPPSQTMTKAFTPQGLLSAGLQDKQDRSAKKQEEMARETGASLINVPNKPPPPQSGLLGAITAHERERKRDGGVGATLTEREREKRLAEERQRKLDEYQRQQLEQMAQPGSMYGAQFPYNPMMMNPMMMGLNPMMTGMNPMMTGMNPMMTGMNPMMTGMGGFSANPQHLFAAQQAAAQAYQQAMMMFSLSGSQMGGDANGTPPQMNPMMTGGGMGYDPRMSMMGMPMMGASMGGPMGSPGGNPMGGQMGGQMGGLMGSPMGGPMGGSMMGGTMGSPVAGPMGGPMGNFMGAPSPTPMTLAGGQFDARFSSMQDEPNVQDHIGQEYHLRPDRNDQNGRVSEHSSESASPRR